MALIRVASCWSLIDPKFEWIHVPMAVCACTGDVYLFSGATEMTEKWRYFWLISPALWTMTHYNCIINLASCNDEKTSKVCSAVNHSWSTSLDSNYFFYLLIFLLCCVSVFMPLENGTEHFHVAERKAEESPVSTFFLLSLGMFIFLPQTNRILKTYFVSHSSLFSYVHCMVCLHLTKPWEYERCTPGLCFITLGKNRC